MATSYADDVFTSDMSDIHDLPLDAEGSFDEVEYAHIMRRIGIAEGEAGTSVSALNSSILALAASRGVLPFRPFVLKIPSRCDLACDYCYVYEHADQSWRGRPTAISSEVVARAGERIAEHARDHRLAEVRVILHGGGPLLAGAASLGSIARDLRRAIEPVWR